MTKQQQTIRALLAYHLVELARELLTGQDGYVEMRCRSCGHGQTFERGYVRRGRAVGICDKCNRQRDWITNVPQT